MSYLDLHKSEIFKKYPDDVLIEEIKKFINGGKTLTKTLNNFFEEDIFMCCGKKTKISPYDVLQNDELMDKILAYIKSKPKFFTSSNEVDNVKSCFRNSMSWVRKVANFPVDKARFFYFKYFDGIDKSKINCLDTSCGFGSRMSAVLLSGSNYFGIDPNKSLFHNLCRYYEFLIKNGLVSEKQKFVIHNTGSETFIDEYNGVMDVCFTSPPYFNLEKYSNDGCQSTNNYDNYQNWVRGFVYPTVNNIYRYLKTGGYAIINIKNINSKNTCYDDFYNAFSSIDGFEFVEVLDLKISKKQYGKKYEYKKGDISNIEPVMVFRKVK